MRAMKDSGVEWIGEIPEGWELVRGKVIFRQRQSRGNTEGGLLSATQQNGMYPQELVEGVVQVKEETDLQTFKTVHRNDFVISLRSFQGGFEISEYEGVCSPAYQVFNNIEPVNHPYFKLLFKSDGFISKMNSLTVGIREGRNILYADFANSLLPKPNIDEQTRIASFLDTKCAQIGAIIEKQQQVIEKLKAYKQSVITEAVTKGLDPTVPMKDSGVEWIGMVPENWVVGTLGRYTKLIQTGPFGSQLHAEDYVTDGISIINPSNIIDGEIVPDTSCSICDDMAQVLSRHLLETDDIVFARRGEMGRCARVDNCSSGTMCGTGCLKIKLGAELLSMYATQYLQTTYVKQYLSLVSIGTTMSNLNSQIIAGIPIVLPSVVEQARIIDYVERMSSETQTNISKKQILVNNLTAYKKSLIYEVVTGKMEV